MNRIAKIVIGFIALAMIAVGLSGCFSNKSVTRNIRVIAQAEVNGKIVEGSVVMGLRWQSGDKGRMYIRTNTEAVILDLGSRGTVYVLDVYMTNDGLSNRGYWPIIVMRTFGIRGQGRLKDFPTLRSAKGRHLIKPFVGKPKTLPLMVTFKDESKLETMFEVKPNDFSKVFGSGVRFVGMWFEFTDDPETDAIVGRLPVALKPNKSFYTAFPQKYSNGRRIPSDKYAFPYKISKFAFFEREH